MFLGDTWTLYCELFRIFLWMKDAGKLGKTDKSYLFCAILDVHI